MQNVIKFFVRLRLCRIVDVAAFACIASCWTPVYSIHAARAVIQPRYTHRSVFSFRRRRRRRRLQRRRSIGTFWSYIAPVCATVNQSVCGVAFIQLKPLIALVFANFCCCCYPLRWFYHIFQFLQCVLIPLSRIIEIHCGFYLLDSFGFETEVQRQLSEAQFCGVFTSI